MATLEDLKKFNHHMLSNMMLLMSEGEKTKLSDQLASISLDEVNEMYQEVYVKDHSVATKTIEKVQSVVKELMPLSELEELNNIGQQAIMERKFAVLLMAGGQGTRLEHVGPKGTFSFGNTSLFELQASQLLKINAKYDCVVPWFIMTSDINHEETLQFFEEHDYFGYDLNAIKFFKQPNVVALSKEGQLLLNKDSDILTAPNGNGGVFEAMQEAGLYRYMEEANITHLFINNIDNVLVKVLDPLLCGIAIQTSADVTTKTIEAKPFESVGRLVSVDGKHQVMEYTELPERLTTELRDANIGIHIFKRDFLMSATNKTLPYHLALKKLEQLDEDFEVVKKETLKFEKFYFDLFKYANTFASLQVDRASEFSPLKNKEGKDSIETARKALEAQGIL